MTLDYEIYKEGGLLKDRYQKLEDISEGSYGYVSLAKDNKEKRLVAVKYIFKNEEDDLQDDENASNNSSLEKRQQMIKHQKSLISDKVKSRLSNNICFEALYEVEIHTKVGQHRNITALYDFFDSYIIMEYCSGGDLYEAIKADSIPRKTRDTTHIIAQIMDAVQFVHDKGIYHRDIKPENILIAGSDWTIKLTDWGLATTEQKSLERNVGSERYMAPELFESNLDSEEKLEPYDCRKVDIWAIGIVLLNIVFHKNPFSVANQTDKSFCYFAANREALFDVFSTMSYDFFQVLRHSLTIDPTNRNLEAMRTELSKLGEYTLDDEYYNSLEEGNSYSPQIEEVEPVKNPPSTASVTVPQPTVTVPQITIDKITPDPSNKTEKEQAPVPRFRFKKRSHPNHDDGQKKSKPIKIYNSTIVKNSRKPLAIPTPNTHINNFFHDYKSKEKDFNTRNFFTPPSVQNKYMEGIFNGKSKPHGGHGNGASKNHKRPSSAGSYNGNRFTPKTNNNGFSSSYGRRNSSTSQHSPSSGKYVPPHSRSSFHNGSPTVPNISSVLDSPDLPSAQTFHEQHPIPVDAEPDLDDVLFTLEENDFDNFADDMNELTIHESHAPAHMTPPPTLGANSENNATNDVPDLLKSPHASHQPLSHDLKNPFNANKRREQGPTMEHKHKPGVYVPPHQRKSISHDMHPPVFPITGSETTLLVNDNSVSYGSYPSRRSSMNHPRQQPSRFGKRLSTNTPSNLQQPFMPSDATTTTAVQQSDIFADTNAVVFEDDEDANELADQRSMFGPHDIYKKNAVSPRRFRAGRKSSSIQDELVGSLEQYKNNWLMLQQQQE